MQALYTIQEVAIFMFQICGFLMGLLVMWLLVLAGAELFRDRINTRTEEKCKEMEILKEKMQEEEARKKKLDKVAAAYDMALRNLRFIDQHLKLKENNYRKMHGFPLIRRRRNHE